MGVFIGKRPRGPSGAPIICAKGTPAGADGRVLSGAFASPPGNDGKVRSLLASAPARSDVRLGLVAALFALSGAAALVYQVAWQRILALHSGVGLYSVAMIVAAFMAGLGVGSHLGGVLSARVERRSALRLFAALELAIAAFGASSTAIYYDWLYPVGRPDPEPFAGRWARAPGRAAAAHRAHGYVPALPGAGKTNRTKYRDITIRLRPAPGKVATFP